MRNIKTRLWQPELLFKILFLLYAFLSFSSVTYGSAPIRWLMWASFLLGGYLLIKRCIHIKRYWKAPGFWAMAGFLASFALSAVVHWRYEFKSNLIHGIYLLFYFFLLYLQDQQRPREELQKEMRAVGWFYLAVMTAGVVASLMMMLAGYSRFYTAGSDQYEVITGFYSGRLWGVFLDPNNAAVMALAAIYLAIWFLGHYKSAILRVVLGAILLLQMLYIAFSGSRTAIVCLFISGGITSLLFLWRRERWWRAILLAVAIAFAAASLPEGIQQGSNLLYNAVEHSPEEESEAEDLFDRGYDLEEDISNRRFAIWGSGLEIFLKTPLVGASYYGIRPYAEEHLPETYILNNDQIDFRNLHNEVVNIAAAQGLSGLVFAAWMLIALLRFLFRRWKHLKEPLPACALLGIVLAVGCGAMFLSAGMFYYFAPTTLIFWIALGHLQKEAA